MNSTHPKWSFREFTTFLLIYVSYADAIFTKEEEAAIKKRIEEKTFEKVLAEYNSLTDAERLSVILTYKGIYYPTAGQKNELVYLIKKQFMADGVFSFEEQKLFEVLNNLI